METKSTSECVVVPVKLNRHENADNLSVVDVFDGAYHVVVNTAQWQDKNRGVYIPVQNYVKVNRPEFAFLKKKENQEFALIKPAKLRGIKSDGVLIPVPNDTPIGEDWTTKLEITHKEDEPSEASKDIASGPNGYNLSKYDVDGAKNYIHEFTPGEECVVTLKYHGQNFRAMYKDGEMFCGGRTQWLKESKSHPIWQAYHNVPAIGEFCRANPNLVLWLECINMQGKYNYGLPPNHRSAVAFDIRRLTGEYFNHDHFLSARAAHNVPVVRELYRGPYSHEKVVELAENIPPTPGVSHEDEGVVVKPVVDRQTSKFERLIYKVISSNFKG